MDLCFIKETKSWKTHLCFEENKKHLRISKFFFADGTFQIQFFGKKMQI
jgi:hypothetical protein